MAKTDISPLHVGAGKKNFKNNEKSSKKVLIFLLYSCKISIKVVKSGT